MNVDGAFSIGSTHIKCEDFTLAKDNVIVLSDGCSGSSEDLCELGGRLLCTHAIMHLANQEFYTKEDYQSLMMGCLHKNRDLIDLYPGIFDATFLMCRVVDDQAHLWLVGDGAVHIKYTNNTSMTVISSYGHAFPYYFSYDLTNQRRQTYNEIANDHTIEAFEERDKFIQLSLDNSESYFYCLSLKQEKFSISSISLFSDGIFTFFDKDKVSINYFDIIDHLTNFKSSAGFFVQRRMQKFNEYIEKNQWKHTDDISVASIIWE